MAYHLVGSKKVQQILAKKGVLEKYISDPHHIQALTACFTGLYPLDNSPEGEEAYKAALENPERFVMKPQREGGGNNIYGQDIKTALTTLSPSERSGYILMDLIKSRPFTNVMVRKGELIESEVVSELGVYGIWVRYDYIFYYNQFVIYYYK